MMVNAVAPIPCQSYYLGPGTSKHVATNKISPVKKKERKLQFTLMTVRFLSENHFLFFDWTTQEWSVALASRRCVRRLHAW